MFDYNYQQTLNCVKFNGARVFDQSKCYVYMTLPQMGQITQTYTDKNLFRVRRCSNSVLVRNIYSITGVQSFININFTNRKNIPVKYRLKTQPDRRKYVIDVCLTGLIVLFYHHSNQARGQMVRTLGLG